MLLGTNGATSAGAATSLVVPTPGGTGPAQGTYVFLTGVWGGGSGLTVSSTGFTSLGTVAMTGSNNTAFVLWKLAGVGEPSSYTVSKGAGGDFAAINCTTWGGRSLTSPISASNSVFAALGPSPISLAVTTITALAGDDLLYCSMTGNNVSNTSPTLTPPGGFGNTVSTYSAVSNVPGTATCYLPNFAGGATGTITGSVAFTGGANDDGAAFLIAIGAGPNSSSVAWLTA